MNEEQFNKLNKYIDQLNQGISSSKTTPPDKEIYKMADELKKSAPKVEPEKQFAQELQTKITNEFKTYHKLQGKKTMNNFNWKIVTAFGASAAIVLIITFGVLGANLPLNQNNTNQTVSQKPLPQFASCAALTETLKENYQTSSYGLLEDLSFGLGAAPQATKSSAESEVSADYSQTNIQVAGVDEADKVKTDGQYIYTIADNNVFIARAYPADKAELISKIAIKNGTPNELFIDGKNLLVFGSRNEDIFYEQELTKEIAPYPYYQTLTFVEIYSLSNPAKPELKRKLDFEGSYSSSRKIGKYVYFVVNSYPNYRIFTENDDTTPPDEPVPLYRDLSGQDLKKTDTSFTSLAGCADVSYIEPIVSNQYVSVIGLPIDDYNKEVTKEVILGSSENIYASLTNLYIANTTWQAYQAGILDKIFGSRADEKTNVYKFSLDKDKITYQGSTEVPGTILNQFSMDEHKDHFRIATTIGHVSRIGSDSTNNVYILDKDLNLVGSLEDIAPGEKFYSTRFMGDRAYLVTFKKVDPFFTVDLSDPTNPTILGKLKIPGYSDYLHPYDDNHIIGIGKETVEAEEGNFAWYQGMKMAIFDVTDVANPKEMHKTIIGDRGTDSPVLNDHKAFLFSKDKNLLVIPVTLAELTDEQKTNTNTSTNTYGEYVFQGSYIYNISLNKGFVLTGRVTHYEDDEIFKKSGYYFYGGDLSIDRNLYIDNSLYSISNAKIVINKLTDLAKEGEINLQ